MNLRMDENGYVSEHLNEFFDIINQLSGLNFDIGNEQQMIMLLNSLPDSYDNFRCAIQSRHTRSAKTNLIRLIISIQHTVLALRFKKRDLDLIY